MFGYRAKGTIETLIGAATRVEGHVHFEGGLRVDGHVRGNVIAESGSTGMLVISEDAKVEGDVHGAHLVVNGEITGSVCATELLELQPKARITGNVTYKTLEMHGGAVVSGRLTPESGVETSADRVLKLATSKN
jgi:cytoskeletal protein CcmA (bactofilin family)